MTGGSEVIPSVNEDANPQNVFFNLAWSTWDEAKLLQPCRYLRGNRHLKVPEEWLKVFPVPFEILHKMEKSHLAELAYHSEG